MGKVAWLLGVLVAIGCSSDIEYMDDKDAGATGGSAGTHSLDATSEWGTGGTSPVDSGADAVADVTQADVTEVDVAQTCGNVKLFDVAAVADTGLVPASASCGNNCQAANNQGKEVTLVVGLDGCPTKGSVITRFPIAAGLAAAFASGQVQDISLVLTADSAYKSNFVAGDLSVFAMTSVWDEGTGSYDGAQWCFATVNCSGCGGAPDNGCCDYAKAWAVQGALGTADSEVNAAGTVTLQSAPDAVTVPLDPARLAPRVGSQLSVSLRSDATLKLYVHAVEGKVPPHLQGSYCADP